MLHPDVRTRPRPPSAVAASGRENGPGNDAWFGTTPLTPDTGLASRLRDVEASRAAEHP